MAAADRHAVTMARFEQMVSACPDPLPPLATVCTALGVATRTLRQSCHEHLGMGPSHYLLLHRLQRARHALQSADSEMATVSGLARQHGFRELGRFAASYRALYGELPSTTLRRSMDG